MQGGDSYGAGGGAKWDSSWSAPSKPQSWTYDKPQPEKRG